MCLPLKSQTILSLIYGQLSRTSRACRPTSTLILPPEYFARIARSDGMLRITSPRELNFITRMFWTFSASS